jgi:hypothetical protein
MKNALENIGPVHSRDTAVTSYRTSQEIRGVEPFLDIIVLSV